MNRNTALAFLLIGALALLFVFHPAQAKPLPSLPVNLVVPHPSVFPSTATTHRVLGPPTITADFMNQVLHVARSPAQGIGGVLYSTGVTYGIDPVYALAFFHHESTFGVYGMAQTTLSIGNIRCSQGYACDPSGGYRSYPSYAASVEDWYALLASVYIAHGLNTVEKIIPVYAPGSDHNDEAAYIASINADVVRWRSGEV